MHTMRVNNLSLLLIIKLPYNYQNIILVWCIFFYHIPILPCIMVTLIEIAVKNRLKWIVILLLFHEFIFMFLHFVWVNSQFSPFLFLSQCSWCMPSSSLQSSWGCMPPPTPFNALKVYMPPASLQCSWGCLPLPPRFPSMLLRMHCILPSSLLKHASRLPSTLILKLIWLQPFNALEDACLPQLPSMLLSIHASRFPSMLLSIHASRFPSMLLRMHCILPSSLLMHASRLPSTLILKLIWLHAANPISFWSDSVLSILIC